MSAPLYRVTNDEVAGMSYVSLTQEKVVKTESFGAVNLDLDENGNAVGVEFFGLVDGHVHSWFVASTNRAPVPTHWNCMCGEKSPLTDEQKKAWRR